MTDKKRVGVISLGCDKNRVDTEKLLGLLKSQLLIFAFVVFAFGIKSRKPSPTLMSGSLLPMFSCKSFMVSGHRTSSL